MLRTIALTGFAALLAAATISLAPPARAQIGNIFSNPTPRPPGSIPRGTLPPPDDEEEVPELPQGRVLPAPNRPLPGQGIPPPGSVQSQPLAPPPGTTVIPQNAQPGIAVTPPQPSQGVAVAPPGANALPGQQQPKSVPQAPATLQPGDEVVTEPPAQKIVNKKARSHTFTIGIVGLQRCARRHNAAVLFVACAPLRRQNMMFQPGEPERDPGAVESTELLIEGRRF